FNETFLTEARVANDAIIGGLNKGWGVAHTTLGHERAGLGAGGGGAGGTATPGAIAGNLDKRAGDFARTPKPKTATDKPKSEKKKRPSAAKMLITTAQGNGSSTDPAIRQQLARLHTLGEIGRYNAERHKAVRSQGGDIPGMANIAKLGMSDIVRLQRDLGLAIVGAQGMLHAYTPEQQKQNDEATGNPFLTMITGPTLYAQAPPIYGGTDQIQRNIIGERA